VTSAAWAETLGASVGLGYIRHPADEVVTADFVRSGSYQVNVGGTVCPATAGLRPPFDPAGHRVRGH
jgi:glycine cleavage system aminomethyltransferase T